MKRVRAAAVAGWLALAFSLAAAPEPAGRAVPRTHAHNDYLHPNPLLDALHHGFVGVEADVFLVGNELRVAHDRKNDWSTVPTLEEAYLKPLAGLKRDHKGGGIYADGTRLLLLIDIKTAAAPTYQRLHEVLDEYERATSGLFTIITKRADGKYEVKRGAVDVVISGNRPREIMAQQAVRYAGYDGRIADIGPDVKPDDAPEFVPLVSDNWNSVFVKELKWDGTGEIPPATRAKLAALVSDAHGEGKLLRLWNLPKDGPAVWGALYDAGVDLINTDDLAGLAHFVESRQTTRK